MWNRLLTFVFAAALVLSAYPAQAQQGATTDYATTSHYVVSGSLGGAFGADAADGSFGMDAAFDYLHNGTYGLELLAAFTPDLHISEFDTVGDAETNTFMVNGIGALPLGWNDAWMPYVSGGLGLISIRNDLEDGFSTLPLVDDNQFGGNLGVGVMGFANHFGIRADLRFFTGIGNEGDVDDPNALLNHALADVNFWRSTFGVAYRW